MNSLGGSATKLPPLDLSPGEIERLKALGYVQ